MEEELSEEVEKRICECEDETCKYYPLRHFQECPRCYSKAYHRTIKIKKEE